MLSASAAGIGLQPTFLSPVSSSRQPPERVFVGIDARFVNAASYDFHLQAGSPAIDAGLTISQIVNDCDGTLRLQGARYDIGAYEYTSSPIPMTPPPRNLRIAAP
jgi:hypothetical protein